MDPGQTNVVEAVNIWPNPNDFKFIGTGTPSEPVGKWEMLSRSSTSPTKTMISGLPLIPSDLLDS
jgi:hypothetical protein